MWKQIEKPKINFHFHVSQNNKFYFNEKTNEYIIQNYTGSYYFNLSGNLHKLNGSACTESNLYYIHNMRFIANDFAFLTNHLICKYCEEFCKQGCFI